MTLKFFLSLLSLVIVLFALAPVKTQATGVTATGGDPYAILGTGGATGDLGTVTSEQGEKRVYEIIGRVINIVLGFLGLIALILVIWSGVQWMTSGGNEDKTKEAKDRMKAGVIGLMIILGAAVLTNFILDMIINVTTGAPKK